MIREVVCNRCYGRQAPWSIAGSDLGPCRYCGAPLPPPPSDFKSLLGAAGGSEAAIPCPAKVDELVSASPLRLTQEDTDAGSPSRGTGIAGASPPNLQPVAERGIEQESWTSIVMPGVTALTEFIFLFRCPTLQLILLLLSATSIGFNFAIEAYLTSHKHWWGLPEEYDYREYIELASTVGMVCGTIIVLKLFIWYFLNNSRAKTGLAILLVILLGIMAYTLGAVGGRLVAPHLDVIYQRPKTIGTVVAPKQ